MQRATVAVTLLLSILLLLTACQDPTGRVIGTEGLVGEADTDCEIFPGTQLRIKCRLQQGTLHDIDPETCRFVPDKNACLMLHVAAGRCVVLDTKEACYKEAVDFSENDPTAVREYLILLFRDLQYQIEDAYYEGRITSTSAAQLINSVELIKRATINEEEIGSLKARVGIFKNEWARLMP